MPERESGNVFKQAENIPRYSTFSLHTIIEMNLIPQLGRVGNSITVIHTTVLYKKDRVSYAVESAYCKAYGNHVLTPFYFFFYYFKKMIYLKSFSFGKFLNDFL